MRIGIITGEYPPMQGGIGDYTHLLAQYLTGHGAYVTIITDVRARSNHSPNTHPVITRWNGRAWLQLRAWAQAQKVDIISLQYQTAAFAMSPWIHFLPEVLRPLHLVTTFHDLRFPYLLPKAGKLRTWIVRHLARHSSAAIATNDEDAEQLTDIRLRTLIPIGSNIRAVSLTPADIQAERMHWAQNNEFLIGYFGLLNRSKGVHTLVAALARMRQQPFPARLLIIGGTSGASDPTNTEYERELKQQVADAGLDGAVTYTGYMDDANVARALSACDVIALPYADGASLRRGSLMAALAQRCAIVTTNPQRMNDQFIDGKNMLLVPPDSPAALADAMLRLLDDVALRNTIQSGARDVSRQFSWEHIAQMHLNFFQRVIETAS